MLSTTDLRDRAHIRLQRALMIALAAIVGCGLLTGCLNRRGGDIPYAPSEFHAPDKAATLPSVEARKIAPLDLLSVEVYQVPDLSSEVQVDSTGAITLPLVGEVKAEGLTDKALSDKLTRLYGKNYLQDPTILVTTKKAVAQQLTVDGSVGSPGLYPIEQPITLIQAIALAKGTSKEANPHRVVIFRQIDGQQKAAAFDLTDIRHGEMDNPTVYGNDIIVVDGSGTRQAFRDALSTIPIVGLFLRF